jgi:NDP-sugar pyrophosphorylase family protein
MTVVGVVPAAGRATRLRLATGSKEALVVDGKPVLLHLLDRLEQVRGCALRVVTRPDKQDVAGLARERGATLILGTPKHIGASLHLGLAGLAADDIALLGFPDTLWEPLDGFVRLLAALDGRFAAVLGLFTTSEAARSDVVEVDANGVVTAIHVKPAQPPSNLIWGCCAVRVGALEGIEQHAQPGTLFKRLVPDGKLAGMRLSDRWLDIGTPEALNLARAGFLS